MSFPGKQEFSNDFIWGVSSSAAQTEGAHDLHGKGLSIWDEFVSKNKIKDCHNLQRASNFYNLYKEDLGILKELKIPNFRFSLSWPRIIPDGTGLVNRQGIHYYHQVIDTCLSLGITPWITLYHWDLPLSLERKGGWTNREILDWFSRYVEVCAEAFGDKVKHWMILNEPLVFTGAGYFAGVHAPGKKGLKNFLAAAHHANLCQAIGYRVMKEKVPDAMVGTTFSSTYVTPEKFTKADLAACKRMDALLNRMFIEPSLGLGYPVDDLPALSRISQYFKPEDSEALKVNFDFVGLQVYTREVVKRHWLTPYLRSKVVPAPKRRVYHTQMGWEVNPDCIGEMVRKYNAYEGVRQIIITENGAAFHDRPVNGRVEDKERIDYLKLHIKEVFRASQNCEKLKGYFVWSLTDNFEWAEGYDKRFGLVYIDYPTQKRIIKDSGFWYRDFLS